MAEAHLSSAVSELFAHPPAQPRVGRFRFATVPIEFHASPQSAVVSTALLGALTHLRVPDTDAAADSPMFTVELEVDVPPAFRDAQLKEGIHADRPRTPADPTVAIHWNEGLKIFFDFRVRRSLVVWQKPVESHETAAPLRFALSWMLRRSGVYLLHAAAIRSPQGKTALVVGAGGSGKSTVSLAALLTPGWTFLGDDYVLLSRDPRGAWLVHSLYGSGKLSDDALAREPMFLAFSRQCPRLRYHEKQKWIFVLYDQFGHRFVRQAPVDCIVAPRVLRSEATPLGLSPMRPGAALRQLAPSTLFQDLMPEPAEFLALAALVRQVPCFDWTLGPDSQENLRVLAAHLERP